MKTRDELNAALTEDEQVMLTLLSNQGMEWGMSQRQRDFAARLLWTLRAKGVTVDVLRHYGFLGNFS